MAITPSASAGGGVGAGGQADLRPNAARSGNADRALGWVVVISIVSLAFNDLPALLPIGEMSQDAFVYAIPVLTLFLLRSSGDIEMPALLICFTVAFTAIALAGVAVNLEDIVAYSFKGRTGLERVSTQGMTFSLGIVIAVLAYNLARRGMTTSIVRGAKTALLIMAGVGVFECASWINLPGLTQVHEVLSSVVHSGATATEYSTRLRMTAFEVSWAGVMLTFFFPFGVVHLKGQRLGTLFYTALVAVLVLLAQSRTAMLVFGFQLLLLAWFYGRHRLDLVVVSLTAVVVGALLLAAEPTAYQKMADTITEMAVGQDGDRDQEENVSNVTRTAAIKGALSMFTEHPLLGVGLGQYGFLYSQHLQADDFRSYEVRAYILDDENTPWPPIYSIHARLLAETGLLGYVIWLGFIVLLFARSFRSMIISGPDTAPLHLAIAMTLFGLLILGASIDSFRFFGGWIAIGLALGLTGDQTLRSSGPLP
jgi:O-antigen ligase